jgi:hypothetical protein
MGLAEVKWPKWGLAVPFLVDGAGFGTWAAHVPDCRSWTDLLPLAINLTILK